MRLAKIHSRASIVIGIAAVLGLSGCATTSSAANSNGTQLQKVTIGEVSPFQGANFLTLVAEQKGFFKENGIDAQFIGVAQNPLAPLLAGNVQIMSIGPNGMSALEQGQQIKFIDAFPSKTTFSLIVPKGSPVEKSAHQWPQVMKDLTGKTLGTTVPGAFVDNIAKYLVSKAGLQPSDVKVTPAGDGASLVAGLSSGVFDSGLVPSPLFEPLIASGKFVQVLDLYKGDVPGFGLSPNTPAVTTEYAAKNPQVVAGFQRAVEEANKWAKDPANKDELTRIVANRLSVDPKTLDAPLATFIAALGETTEYTKSQWDEGVAMLRQNGVLSKDFAYQDYVVPFTK